jgi:hypothetical protein
MNCFSSFPLVLVSPLPGVSTCLALQRSTVTAIFCLIIIKTGEYDEALSEIPRVEA